ncbi:MAG: helix-turn-helix domain-containing protein [Bauldia sp.]|nr:helix-turn-helix domain-containing protein [Bauldia sp.]
MEQSIELVRVFIHPDGRMNRKSAANYIGCAVKTLADWSMRGVGPRGVRVGGRIFYFRQELDRWIGEQSRSGTGGA